MPRILNTTSGIQKFKITSGIWKFKILIITPTSLKKNWKTYTTGYATLIKTVMY